jgi:hypothetical protein
VVTWAGPFNGEAHPSHTLRVRVEADTTRPRPHTPRGDQPAWSAVLGMRVGAASALAGRDIARTGWAGRAYRLCAGSLRVSLPRATASTSLRRPSSALGTSQGHDTG